MLSESFLNAEATATAQMVAQQEALLQQENKINEKENQKFIEVLNEKDVELVGHDENGIPDGSSTEIVPNVFKNINAQTGASIGEEAKPVKVASPEQNVFEAASDAWSDLANEGKKEEVPKKIEETPAKVEQAPQKIEEPTTVSASSAMENILQHQEKAIEEQKE